MPSAARQLVFEACITTGVVSVVITMPIRCTHTTTAVGTTEALLEELHKFTYRETSLSCYHADLRVGNLKRSTV